MKKNIIIPVLLFMFSTITNAQNISLSFPALAKEKGTIYFFQGKTLDSIPIVLNDQGKAILPFPIIGFRGLIKCVFGTHGNWEAILAEPHLNMSSSDTTITIENCNYLDSKENNFMKKAFSQKMQIQKEEQWIAQGLNLYKPSDKIYTSLKNQDKTLKKNKADLQKEIETSSLYAGEFLDLLNFYDQVEQLQVSKNELLIKEIKIYLNTRFNPHTLYRAGTLWQSFFNYWITFYIEAYPNKEAQELFAQNVISSQKGLQEPLRSALLNQAVHVCEEYPFSDAQATLVTYMAQQGLLVETENPEINKILYMSKVLPGHTAPDIILNEQRKMSTLQANHFFIIFYQTGCSHCDQELQELQKHYLTLKNKGVEIISISADTDLEFNKLQSEKLSWHYKLCDGQGAYGDNFINYGILLTPTIFVLDKNLKVVGRYAKLEETGLLN